MWLLTPDKVAHPLCSWSSSQVETQFDMSDLEPLFNFSVYLFMPFNLWEQGSGCHLPLLFDQAIHSFLMEKSLLVDRELFFPHFFALIVFLCRVLINGLSINICSSAIFMNNH